MVVDTSALLAVLYREPDWSAYLSAMAHADGVNISAVSILEASIAVEVRLGAAGQAQLDALIREIGCSVEPFDQRQMEEARRAFHRFGKGRHIAKLNFGDCCSYSLAAVLGEPLLFKGSDFSETDIAAALT